MIYWCKKCGMPIFNTELHRCSCDGELVKISTSNVCNPVFLQERKLLSKIIGLNITSKSIWYLGNSKYFYDGSIRRIPYLNWYKQKKHLNVAEELRAEIELEDNYAAYINVVEANKKYIQSKVFEAEQYIYNIFQKYKDDNYIPTVSFSGGKDSAVVSRLVCDALQNNSVIHFFGDTTLEFPETYDYVMNKFHLANPRIPIIKSETNKKFFDLCKVFGPPSQHERWCCTIFKTSNLNKEYSNLPGKSLTFLGIRHSESNARKKYERTQEVSKISSQINAMPIIEWSDYDVWLYILYKNLVVNDCYQYGYKRVGCWCCPNNSDWSMMLTEIYHPDKMKKWRDMIYDFAIKTKKENPDDYYENGRWKTRRGASGLQAKNISIIDTACNLSDRARNIIVEKPLSKDVLEFFKPLGNLKVIEKDDFTYVSVYDMDKSNKYRKCFELILKYGYTVIKVLPEQRIDISNLVNRLKCQMRKYQFCIRCSACDSVCPNGAIDTIHGKYIIDESKCKHCKHCIAKFYNGCIMCDILAKKKGE